MKNVDGVDDVVLDFANLILHIKATDISRVLDEVRKIEPEVELVPKDDHTIPPELDRISEGVNIKKELALLILQLFF